MNRRNAASQKCARRRIIRARGEQCEKCGVTGYIILHHIVPVICGGTYQNANLSLLCPLCHKYAHGLRDHSIRKGGVF